MNGIDQNAGGACWGMFKRFLMLVAALACVVTPIPAQAARVAPMVVELRPSGRLSIARVELSNPEDRPFPVEVRMMRGEVSETGQLTLAPADNDFLIFPAQRIVEPRSQQVFRIQYVGDPNVTQSQVYYASVRQVPVAVTGDQSQVQVVVHFNVLVNVAPAGARAAPVVDSVQATTRNGQAGLQVRLKNDGNRFFLAGLRPWRVTGRAPDGTAFERRIEPAEMARLIGVGLVAPGKARSFFLPVQQPLSDGRIELLPES